LIQDHMAIDLMNVLWD